MDFPMKNLYNIKLQKILKSLEEQIKTRIQKQVNKYKPTNANRR